MKAFLGTMWGKVIAVLVALVVFGGIGAALMFGGKDSDKETQSGEGEGLIVIEEGEETDDAVIDATDWEDLTGEESTDGNTDANTNSNTNDASNPNSGSNSSTNDNTTNSNGSNTDSSNSNNGSNTDSDKDTEDNKDDDSSNNNNNNNNNSSTTEQWGPFF